jgi:hypothetical protein
LCLILPIIGAVLGRVAQPLVNGNKVGQGRIEATQCCAYSATEGNTGTPVSPDYMNPFRFNGKIEKGTIDLKDGDQGRRQRQNRARARRIEPQEGVVELNLSSVGSTSASGHEQPTEAEPILRLLIFKFQTETLRTSWILQDALHNAACIIRRESIDEDRPPEASCPHSTATGDY